jgi:phage/plasmid-like protein (TIGR03299 family)
MTHHVETMAYVNAPPWHRLGNPLPAHQPIEVWARKAGMNWHIEEAPVRFMAESVGMLHAIRSFPAKKVLFRSDTQAPLAVVSQRFQVVQPHDILEFYRGLMEIAGFELETAGVLMGGRKLWALASTGRSFTLPGNDVTQAYVLLATACDGTLATTAQFTSVRVVCHNTLAVALSGNAGAVKVPHNTAFNAQAVKQKLGIAVSAWDTFEDRMAALSFRRVTPSEAVSYLSQVLTGRPGQTSIARNEKTIGKVLALFDGQGKGAHLASAQGTAWGLLNSITEFVDHHRRARSADHRLDGAWFGHGATVKQKALEEALKLVS